MSGAWPWLCRAGCLTNRPSSETAVNTAPAANVAGGQFDAAHFGADDIRDPIDRAELIIEEGVIAFPEFEHAPILAD